MEEKDQVLVEHLNLQAVVGDEEEEKEEEIEEEEEEEKEEGRLEIDEKVEIFLKNPLHLKMVTRNDENSFTELVDEVCSAWENTTWRGSERKMKHRAQKSPKLETALFLTLFWMAHYPTLSLIGSMFDIHPRTLTRILKRMTVTLNQVLKDEVKWPTDEELDSLTDGLLQNEGFCDAVCVVDGSEIRIS